MKHIFIIVLILAILCVGCGTTNAAKTNDEKAAIMTAAEEWARAFKHRDGNIRYDLLTPELQEVFFKNDKTVVSEENLFKEKGIIVTGWSSPWVDSYTIHKLEDQNKVIITYSMLDSTQTYYKMTEELTFEVKGKQAKVTEYTTSELNIAD